MTDLQQVSTRFSSAYHKNKKARAWLDKQQKRLFEAFDADLEETQLAQKTVIVPDNADVNIWLQEHYPGWLVLHVRVSDVGTFAVMQENPSAMKHRYTNRITGEVVGRDVVQGSPTLDDDALREAEPELWEQITEWPEPWVSLVKDVVRQFTSLKWSEDALDDVTATILQDRGVKKVIVDPSRMTDEDLAAIQPFLSPGPISVRLSPPRPVKPEELEVDNA